MDADGDFVVVWESDGSAGTDTRRLQHPGAALRRGGQRGGSQFQVNTYTTNVQPTPAVAMDADGDFVVVWQSYGSAGTDTSGYSIQGQRYDAAGIALGSQFQVNTYTTSYQIFAAVAMDADGDFVVAWQSNGSDGTDTSSFSIRRRRYDSAGARPGHEFQVNDYTTGTQGSASVASDADGDFVVAWQSDGSSGTDTSESSIQAQRFNAAGGGFGEFQVNSYTTYYQLIPAVAMDADGDFVVAWAGEGSGGTDTSDRSVQAQRFRASGATFGGELQVNTFTTGTQAPAAVGMNANGNFVIAWASLGSSGTDTSDQSIQAQLYDALFRDGFEGASPGRWSSTVPP